MALEKKVTSHRGQKRECPNPTPCCAVGRISDPIKLSAPPKRPQGEGAEKKCEVKKKKTKSS